MQKFLNTELVKEFGLRVSSCGVGVKEVNSKAKETTCVSSSIHIQIDKWEGWGNSTMMPVDEFEVAKDTKSKFSLQRYGMIRKNEVNPKFHGPHLL
jgi:hypothetical protein